MNEPGGQSFWGFFIEIMALGVVPVAALFTAGLGIFWVVIGLVTLWARWTK